MKINGLVKMKEKIYEKRRGETQGRKRLNRSGGEEEGRCKVNGFMNEYIKR